MPNRSVNLAPYPYTAQQAEIDRRRKMAQALQQQAMEPIEQPTMPGVRISPVQGLAKLLQQFAGQYQQGKLDKEQRALDTARQTEQQKRALEMARTIVPQANPADYAVNVGQPGSSSAMSGAAATPLPPPVATGSSGNESIASPRMVAPMPMPIPQGFQMNSPAAAQQATTQQVNTLGSALASPDPIQQQMAQAMMGDIYSQKREQRASAAEEGKLKLAAAIQAQDPLRQAQLQKLNEPDFVHFGTATGGELYGSVAGGKFTQQGQIAPSVPKVNPPNTPFEVWRAANPTKNVEDWVALNKQKPEDTDAAVALTPEALDVAARRYLQDGTLPPMGMGSKASGARSRILNRAASIDPNAAIAANKAEYTSNAAALTQLQKNSDAIGAFENTAKKNLNQFIATANKVSDSGSPWINRGMRSVNRNLLGTPEQAAYDAARQVALTEIARVVSNPNLSGVLSDQARKEMEGIISGDATLAQTLAVSKILLQDMDNRKSSVNQQLSEIKGRLRQPTAGSTGTPKATHRFNPQTGQVEAIP